MSSARQGLQIVGQIAGSAFGPIGAAIGGFIGGELGGAIDGPPEGPRLDDTSAPTLEFGAKVPRLYGRTWCTLSPRWWSGLRESSEVVGGKGADSGVDQAVYHADLLGVLGEVDLARWPDPVWLRIRIDGKVVASRLATSSTETLTTSAETEQWADVELFNGNAAQAPWSVMEAVEGATNAIAYRGQVTMGFTNLLMPNGRRPSLIEVEVATEATLSTTNANVLLTVGFDTDASDGSAYNHAVAFNGSAYSFAGGALVIGPTIALTGPYWSGAGLAPDFTNGFTAEAVGTWDSGVADESYVLRYQGGTVSFFIAAEALTAFPSAGWRFRIRGSDIGSPTLVGPIFPAGEMHHIAFVRPPGASPTMRVYVDGVEVYTVVQSDTDTGNGYFDCAQGASGPATVTHTLNWVAVRRGEIYTADFTPPLGPPAADAGISSYAPLQVDLQDVLESEMLRCRPLVAGQINMAAAAGKLVWGFKAADSAAKACATLLDWYYLDLFCTDQITAVARGGAVEQTIPYGYTGAGVADASEPFAGLTRNNDVEQQRSTSVGYINIQADGEAGSVNGARIGTGNAVRQISFPIYAIASEAKGRADTITHDTRVATHKATVRLSARHAAKMQPASVVTLVDNKGISYRVRVLRLVWNRGAYEVDVCLDDPNILTDVGIANDIDTAVVEVPAPGVAEFLALDLPKLQAADDAPGYLGLVKTPDAAGARWFDSADDVTYAAQAEYANDAVFGVVTAKTGSFSRGTLFDEASTLTVNVGDGVLASATRAALLASRTLNAFAVGINGRLVLGQYRTATQLSPGVFTLTGFVNMGAKGTERYCSSIVAGDAFALLGTQGTARIPRTLAQLGAVTYTKAVAVGRNIAGVTGVSITPVGVSLKPLAPVDLRAARNATSGDIALTATRRTRGDTRFGGALGDVCPLGEAIDERRWRLYTDATYTTLLRELGVTTNATGATYTAAQRATDGHSLYSPVYVAVAQVSDVVGAGYELQATA